MRLVNENIKIKWARKTKQWYIDRGYEYTQMGDIFSVNTNDLTDGSHAMVNYFCDGCNEVKQVCYKDYLKKIKENDKYYCNKCAIKLYDRQIFRDSRLKNSVSFEEWCFDNLDNSKANEILSRWDYDLNKCNPSEITYCSGGITGKGYWFKCSINSSHKSELKRIADFVLGNLSNLDCKQCKSIYCTHPELVKYFVNKDDVYKYSSGSHRKVSIQCPDCMYEKNMQIKQLVKQGLGCNQCSCGTSYPERLMIALLNHLEINYVHQFSRKNANWCNNLRYDFYLTDYNIIIETHGGQHYKERSGWGNVQENDIMKKELALANGINQYIVIDARRSSLLWIKKSIINSPLKDIFDLTNVDWKSCESLILMNSNSIKISGEMYNNGFSIKAISDELMKTTSTIRGYLKKANNMGWTNYKPKSYIKAIS